MTKQKVFPIVGLVASCLIIFNHLFAFILNLLEKYNACWNNVIAISVPALIICIFFAIKYLLVERATLQDFNIVVSLLIVFQSIGLFLICLQRLSLNDSKAFIFGVAIAGLLIFVFYLWFFIKLSNTSSDEVFAYSFLNLYAITYLLFMFLGALPEFLKLSRHKDFDKLSYILQICNIIPYIFLIIYFYKNLKISRKTSLVTST